MNASGADHPSSSTRGGLVRAHVHDDRAWRPADPRRRGAPDRASAARPPPWPRAASPGEARPSSCYSRPAPAPAVHHAHAGRRDANDRARHEQRGLGRNGEEHCGSPPARRSRRRRAGARAAAAAHSRARPRTRRSPIARCGRRAAPAAAAGPPRATRPRSPRPRAVRQGRRSPKPPPSRRNAAARDSPRAPPRTRSQRSSGRAAEEVARRAEVDEDGGVDGKHPEGRLRRNGSRTRTGGDAGRPAGAPRRSRRPGAQEPVDPGRPCMKARPQHGGHGRRDRGSIATSARARIRRGGRRGRGSRRKTPQTSIGGPGSAPGSVRPRGREGPRPRPRSRRSRPRRGTPPTAAAARPRRARGEARTTRGRFRRPTYLVRADNPATEARRGDTIPPGQSPGRARRRGGRRRPSSRSPRTRRARGWPRSAACNAGHVPRLPGGRRRRAGRARPGPT